MGLAVGTDPRRPRLGTLSRRIGWVEADGEVYLDPEAAYAEAAELARQQGEGLPVTAATLRRRLHERGLLASTDGRRQKLLIRRTLGGVRRDVLHIVASALSPPDETGPTGPICENAPENGPVSRAGLRAGNGKPAQQPAQKTGQSDELGRLGRSDTGVGGPPAENSKPRRYKGTI